MIDTIVQICIENGISNFRLIFDIKIFISNNAQRSTS